MISFRGAGEQGSFVLMTLYTFLNKNNKCTRKQSIWVPAIPEVPSVFR